MACDLGDDTGWVCEDHADRPLKGDSNRADACSFGAGKPCPAAIVKVGTSTSCRGYRTRCPDE